MTDEQVRLLARFLTGSRLIEASVQLERPLTARGQAAVEFFALRKAFGLQAYESVEVAEERIRQHDGSSRAAEER